MFHFIITEIKGLQIIELKQGFTVITNMSNKLDQLVGLRVSILESGASFEGRVVTWDTRVGRLGVCNEKDEAVGLQRSKDDLTSGLDSKVAAGHPVISEDDLKQASRPILTTYNSAEEYLGSLHTAAAGRSGPEL